MLKIFWKFHNTTNIKHEKILTMKKFFFSIASVFILIIAYVHTTKKATIVQSYAITDVCNYINHTLKPEEVLIVFDIDNTVAESVNQLASTQWFTAMHTLKEQCGMSKMESVQATLPLYFLLAQHCPLQPVEPTTVALIKELQDKKYKVMALTIRTPQELKTYTINHLLDIDINFARNTMYSEDIIFSNNIQYSKGILFIDGGNKGDSLLRLLKQVDYMPKQIIFIDDKEYNHHAVEGALMQNGIAHSCIWYRYCDAKVNTFDLALTEAALLNLCKQYPLIHDAYQEWLSSSPKAEYSLVT